MCLLSLERINSSHQQPWEGGSKQLSVDRIGPDISDIKATLKFKRQTRYECLSLLKALTCKSFRLIIDTSYHFSLCLSILAIMSDVV